MYHFTFSIDGLGIPLGSQPIKFSLARHSVSRCLWFPAIGSRGHFWTFQFLPTGLHGLCFGFCFAGPLPLRSLTHGPLFRVRFGESLVFRLYSEIEHIHLSCEAQCVSHLLPPGDCHTTCVKHIILTTWSRDIQKGGKRQAPDCSVSDKGTNLRLKPFSVVLTKPT